MHGTHLFPRPAYKVRHSVADVDDQLSQLHYKDIRGLGRQERIRRHLLRPHETVFLGAMMFMSSSKVCTSCHHICMAYNGTVPSGLSKVGMESGHGTTLSCAGTAV